MTLRAITLGDDDNAPYLVAECDEKGWNGFHVPHLTATELADHFEALKRHEPNSGWEEAEVLTDAPEGIMMRTEGGDDLWAYDESGRAWVDGLVWSTARDENGDERTVEGGLK